MLPRHNNKNTKALCVTNAFEIISPLQKFHMNFNVGHSSNSHELNPTNLYSFWFGNKTILWHNLCFLCKKGVLLRDTTRFPMRRAVLTLCPKWATTRCVNMYVWMPYRLSPSRQNSASRKYQMYRCMLQYRLIKDSAKYVHIFIEFDSRRLRCFVSAVRYIIHDVYRSMSFTALCI